jgi:hypothetical protein
MLLLFHIFFFSLDETTKPTNPQSERRDGPSSVINNPPGQKQQRQTARNIPFFTPNNNTPTSTTRR